MDNMRLWLTENRDLDDRNKKTQRQAVYYQTPLQDILERLYEPGSADVTRAKLDSHNRKMVGLRNMWVEQSRKRISKSNLKTQPKRSKNPPSSQIWGEPHQDYDTYHKATVSLLLPAKEELDTTIKHYEKKRWRQSKNISEKSGLVDLKGGNAPERAVEKMITPLADEIGEQACREEEADWRLEMAEEMEDEEVIARARRRVGLEIWRAVGWWRGESEYACC
jgi:hypothetical protein